ncbi:AAA family ATPase [Actinotalea sp. M2MS4P-6]|uniref:AAA family ATPase n=1 Tax=Actinotalea sp. M2MS4P-6 TaxID=2983762 RepID=UPI00296257AE|nr:AAA family ATPase [Actinotalea sp. M2MS4P-6]
MTAAPRRVRVVGLPGSGKTTLAREAAHRLGVPRLDLDTVMRLPGGRVAGQAEYRAAVRSFLQTHTDGWVVDGDDVDQVGVRYDDADLVIWIDVSRAVAVGRVLRRALLDLLTDTRAWHGGRETWGLLVGRGPSADLARWTWRRHAERTARYAGLAAAEPDRWVRVPSRDSRWWLEARLAPRPRRVRVLGSSGAGKSTFGARLAERLGVAFLEIDSAYHLPGWQPATQEQVAATLGAFLDGPGRDGWVIDGNYSSLTAVAALEPDLVVWLDTPRARQMSRLVRRTVGRAALRRELWNGNRERARSWLRREPEENILRWGWVMGPRQRAQFARLMAGADVPWLRLRTRSQVRRALRAL